MDFFPKVRFESFCLFCSRAIRARVIQKHVVSFGTVGDGLYDPSPDRVTTTTSPHFKIQLRSRCSHIGGREHIERRRRSAAPALPPVAIPVTAGCSDRESAPRPQGDDSLEEALPPAAPPGGRAAGATPPCHHPSVGISTTVESGRWKFEKNYPNRT
ncbi:unnamed protein product [Nesidiocoris tenuis]|uniref:Uncharacterized protein n=1 Tax=Nesidiocoris tenuis TaxID=355587 RepID=A0A6H5GYJ7_9HEMI|nr:unnamed protein product [Nesidiocoris tenuis]